MNNENYCNVFVHVLTDGHFVPLGQLSLTTRIRDVAQMVLAKKKLEGLQNLCLGYMLPYKEIGPQEIVYLPPETLLSEAKEDISRVSFLASHLFGTLDFGKSHFGTDVSSWEHFCMCTVQSCERSGRWTLQQGKVSTWGLFGMRNFWHRNISVQGYFDTEAQVRKCMCQNIHIALQGAKISICQNVHVPNYPCQKVPVPKSLHVQTFPC